MGGGELREVVPVFSFQATLDRVTAAIAQAGPVVINRIDHHVSAQEEGLAMPPSTVLTYGHAKSGTPIMLAAPCAALELPLRLFVRARAEGETIIAFHPIAAVLRRSGVSATLAERLEPAQQLLVKAVTP
jgi:uncharacterized protein (DUF302 family)